MWKRLALILAVVGAPVLARAGGLINLDPAETKLRNAQKDLKKGVDKETDKHHVTVGGDDARKPPKKASKDKPKKK